MKTIKQLLPLLAATVALLLVFRYWVPSFLGPENLLDLAQQVSVNAILAFGMTLAILIGGIDLSVGALLALVGTVAVSVLSAQGDAAQSAMWSAGRGGGRPGRGRGLRRLQRPLCGEDQNAAVHHYPGHDARGPRLPPAASTMAGPCTSPSSRP